MEAEGTKSEPEDERDKRLGEELEEFGIPANESFLMDLKHKQELLDVCRLSKSTAQEEDKERKSFLFVGSDVDGSDDDLTQLQDDTVSSPNSKIPAKVAAEQHQLSQGSKSFQDVPVSDKESTGSSPDLIVIKEISRTPLSTTKNSSTKLKEVKRTKDDSEFINEESDLDLEECDRLQYVPRQKTKEDRIRNIDVWNCVKTPNEKNFDHILPAVKRVNPVPFHFPPPGISYEDYIDYFKKHTDILLKAHYEQQRQSLRFVPWGKPILPGAAARSEKNVFSFDSLDDEAENLLPGSNSERYNLRRNNFSSAVKKRNPSSAFLEDKEIFSSDEDIVFPSKRKKNDLPTSEVKNASNFDSLVTKSPGLGAQALGYSYDEEFHKELTLKDTEQSDWKNVNKNMKQNHENSSSEFIVDDDSDGDFVPAGKEIFNPKIKLPLHTGPSATKRRRGPNKNPRKNNKSVKTQETENKMGESLWMSTSNPQIEIKPHPITGLSKTTKQRIKRDRSNNCGQEDVSKLLNDQDITEELNDSNEIEVTEEHATMLCPMCSKSFPADQIQDHANKCCDELSQKQEGHSDTEAVGDECMFCHKRVSEIDYQLHRTTCRGRKDKTRRIVPGARGGKVSR